MIMGFEDFVKLELYKKLVLLRLPMHSWLEISWIADKVAWEPLNSFGWRSNLPWLWVMKTLSSLNCIKDLSSQGYPCIHDLKYHGQLIRWPENHSIHLSERVIYHDYGFWRLLWSLNYIKDLSSQGYPCIHDLKYHG